jgi:hypothetical protein
MSRKVADTAVYSQDETKITKASRREVIAALQAMVESDPDAVISRNRFRVESRYAESAWNVHFGTFDEFKRQAGIILSRHAHRLEKSVAKHASVDKMRVLNADKRQWAGKYLRPASGRWQTALVGADMHGLHCDPFYRRTFLDTARRAKPETIVLDGDAIDLAEFSKHTHDPREFRVVEEIHWLHRFLADIRKAAPDAEIQYVEGNHEYRMLRHMAEESPAMMVVLADLHGMTISKLLGLAQFEVNYISQASMTAFTERDIKAELMKNYVTLWDHSVLFGHYPHMRNMGIPGASAHHHKHVVWADYDPVYGPKEWHQLGCGHRRDASYTPGQQWGNGFLLAHVDTQTRRSQMEYLDVSHDGAFIGGKHYERTPDEPVPDLIGRPRANRVAY